MSYSCKDSKLDDIKVGTQICTDMTAEKFELLYTHQKTPVEKYFIEYVLHKSEILESKRLDSNFIASYVAMQLYRGLSSKTLKKNEAISVIFDNKNYVQNFINPKYYYPLSKLQLANKSVSNVDLYIQSIVNNDFSKTINYVDTSLCNLDTINFAIKQKVFRFNLVNLTYGFWEMEFTIKNIDLSCICIAAIIRDKFDGNKQTYVKILTNKTDNKIVDFLIEE